MAMVGFLSLQMWHNKAVLLASQQTSPTASWVNQITLLYLLLALSGIATLLIACMPRQKNQTTRELKRQQSLIEAKNEAIAAQNQALLEANQEVKQLLRAKSSFMSQMSHEIRTPMNSILGLTDLLLQEAGDSEMMDKLQSIRYSADILLVIINDILDLAAIEDGHVPFVHSTVNLPKIAQEIQRNLYPKALQKDIAFEIDLDANLPAYVHGDVARLFQVLINLSNNALKFTKEGKVTLKITTQTQSQTDCCLRFEVMDTGIGIKEELLPYIFRSFEQGGSDIQKEYGGTGLGLTIAQKLVDMMGGELKVTSTPLKGSTFWFDLWFDLASTAAAEDTSHGQLPPHFATSEIKVLYAEDNLMNQKVMSLILRTYGIVPVLANHGVEALKLLEKAKFDLVLMDFRMPEMDGFETTRRIRAYATNHPNYNIPIIGVTADVFDENAGTGLDLGMNATLTKPIEKEKLEKALFHYLSHSKANRPLKATEQTTAH